MTAVLILLEESILQDSTAISLVLQQLETKKTEGRIKLLDGAIAQLTGLVFATLASKDVEEEILSIDGVAKITEDKEKSIQN